MTLQSDRIAEHAASALEDEHDSRCNYDAVTHAVTTAFLLPEESKSG